MRVSESLGKSSIVSYFNELSLISDVLFVCVSNIVRLSDIFCLKCNPMLCFASKINTLRGSPDNHSVTLSNPGIKSPN